MRAPSARARPRRVPRVGIGAATRRHGTAAGIAAGVPSRARAGRRRVHRPPPLRRAHAALPMIPRGRNASATTMITKVKTTL